MKKKIGDYIIDQSFEPRTGSFGSTYRGKHPLFKGKLFAIKVINDIDGRKKFDFITEIEALLSLQFQSEHIVVFSYAGETPDGDLYCAMEYCEGGDLNELCIEKKGLPDEHVALIGRQACIGLAEAHGQGIVHRDIKPSNMMLGRLRNGELGVKLIDFGLAKTLDDTMQSAPGVKGTPLFASPEQIRDEDLDSRSDLYSLGVAMWYLLQGKKPKPLDLDSRHEVEAEHVNYDRPFKVKECDKDLAAILEKMMAKKRAERYTSASEVLAALDAYLKKKSGFPENYLSCSDLVDDVEGATKGRQSPPVLDENRSIAERRSDRFEDAFDNLTRSSLDCSWSKFMLARKKDGGARSLIAILNTQLFKDGNQKTFDEVKQLVDSHLVLQSTGRGYPDAFLRPKAFYWFTGGEAVIEFEPREGVLLRDVVRRHGRFQFSHALPLLSTLADLLDYTAEMEVPVPTVGEAEILLVPSDHSSNDQFLSQSIPKWPRHRVEVNPLSLPASISFNSEEFDVEQTLDSNDAIISSVGEDFPAAVVYCARLYRLIGGKPVPSVAYQSRYGYSSISGLTEESNNLLCDHICGSANSEAKCSDILRSICDAEGENFSFAGIDFTLAEDHADGAANRASDSSSAGNRGSRRAGGFGGIESSRRGSPGSGPPTLPNSDIEASISVSAGPQYQSYNLPEAVSTGPGEFRNPITKKRFSLPGPEIRPYRQFICQETGDMFQLSAQIEALECLADVKEPGIIHSPYIPVGQDTRINFLETEGVELWQQGERGTCPVSGLQYKLPAGLPLLKAIIYENEPGKVSSPFFPNEEDCQAIGPDLWVGGTVLSTRNREFVLPKELPSPILIKKVDEYRGIVTSPFVDAEFNVPDNDWKKGNVLSCQITDLLCQLPKDLPERRHVARIHGDGSEGIVVNPFTNREQKIPGKDWRSNQKIRTEDGKEFLLPSVIPELKVSKYLLDKPGWIVDPYSGAKTDLLPDEWELGLSVEREGRSFLLLDKLPQLKNAKLNEGVFDKVISPYSRTEILVKDSRWKRREILKCPESKCLCRLPDELPKHPEIVSEIPQQDGFIGTIESPYVSGKVVEVPGEKWMPAELIQCPHSNEFFKLPGELPPLVGETLEADGKLKAFSPYSDHEEQEVPASDWVPGKEIECAKTGRIFKLPSSYETLPRMSAEVLEGPGVIRVPQTGDEMQVGSDLWSAGSVVKVDSDENLELQLPDSIPAIKSANVVSEETFGEVRSPYTDEVIEISNQEDWSPGKILRDTETGFLYKMPEKLPEWTLTAMVDLEKTGEKGFVFSPYDSSSGSIEIAGADWEEGNKILCGKSKRNFILPELPPLQASLIDGKNGIVACPYSSAKKRDQKIDSENWVEGKEIESTKVKGRIFILPSNLPALLAKTKKDRPGCVVSPYDSASTEIEVDGGDWIPDHILKCPATGRDIITPSKADLPVPRSGNLVKDEEIAGAFVTGVIESPYASGKNQNVSVSDWRAEKLVRCEASGLLMKLPSAKEGFPVWADEAKLDRENPGSILHPETGNSIPIEGTLWERRAVVTLDDASGITVQLPRELPPLTASVPESGKVNTPYEKGSKGYEIALEDWEPNKVVSCPATGRPLQLPGDLPLPEAQLDDKIVGVVISPYQQDSSIRVPLKQWKPSEVIEDSAGKKIQLPGTLPGLPEASEFDLETVEVTPPFSGSKVMSPSVWKAGELLTCPETGGHFVLPGKLQLPVGKLTADARKALPTSHGIIVDPFSGKEIEIGGESWVAGSKVKSKEGNEFQLPEKLPLLSAVLDTNRPGFVESPYSKARAFRLGAISDWVESASVKCPKTQRTMVLPAKLPFSQEEVLKSWENTENKKKSLMFKLAGIAGVILVVGLFIMLKPDPAERWAEWQVENKSATGLDRLELAAKAMGDFPDKSQELSAYAAPTLQSFSKHIDTQLPSLSPGKVRELERHVQAFSQSDSKVLAVAAVKILNEGKRLNQIATSPVTSLPKEGLELEIARIQSDGQEHLPALASAAISALTKQLESLSNTPVEGEKPVVTPEPKEPVVAVVDTPVAKEKEVAAPVVDKDKGSPGKSTGTGFVKGQNFVTPDGQEFIWIEPGSFKMGIQTLELEKIYKAWGMSWERQREPAAPKDEKIHDVRLSEGFWIAKTEVTIGQYLQFLNENKKGEGAIEKWIDKSSATYFPYDELGDGWELNGDGEKKWGGLTHPVVEVTRSGALAFSEWMSKVSAQSLPDGYAFSLPSEAQWEYAARAGSQTPLPGSSMTFKGMHHCKELGEIGWYAGNSDREVTTDFPSSDFRERELGHNNKTYLGSMPVATKQANDFGLHDMIGNVGEWCYDFYIEDLSVNGGEAKVDPIQSVLPEGALDEKGVVRGGSFQENPVRCRVSRRKWQIATRGKEDIGFRVALIPKR